MYTSSIYVDSLLTVIDTSTSIVPYWRLEMLPQPDHPEFPSALKRAREALGLNFSQLAKLCDISPVMPSRYEDPKHGNFGPPSKKTWEKLNRVLFDQRTNVIDGGNTNKLLCDATVDELVQALKNRGAASVTLTF